MNIEYVRTSGIKASPITDATITEAHLPRVLIVDDDPMTVSILKKISTEAFKQACFFSAASVQDANLILNQYHMDYIISDYYLEGKATGLDLWYVASEISPWSNFLIISVMAFDQYLDLVSGISYPPTYIGKPFSKKEIKRFFNQQQVKEKNYDSYI